MLASHLAIPLVLSHRKTLVEREKVYNVHGRKEISLLLEIISLTHSAIPDVVGAK